LQVYYFFLYNFMLLSVETIHFKKHLNNTYQKQILKDYKQVYYAVVFNNLFNISFT